MASQIPAGFVGRRLPSYPGRSHCRQACALQESIVEEGQAISFDSLTSSNPNPSIPLLGRAGYQSPIRTLKTPDSDEISGVETLWGYQLLTFVDLLVVCHPTGCSSLPLNPSSKQGERERERYKDEESWHCHRLSFPLFVLALILFPDTLDHLQRGLSNHDRLSSHYSSC